MAQNNEDGRYGEIANQAGVVIQTQQDMKDLGDRIDTAGKAGVDHFVYPAAGPSTDNAVCRVDINDLVFTVGYNLGGGRGKLNNAIPVSSHVNGLYISKQKMLYDIRDPSDEEEVLQTLSETIRVVGQALGGTNPMPDSPAYLKTNFTTRAQGSAHITNTGVDTLNPGDTILWDFFRKDEIMDTTNGKFAYNEEWKSRMARYGYNLRKVPLKLVKLSQGHVSFEKSLLKEGLVRKELGLGANVVHRQSSTAQGKFANSVYDFLAEFLVLAGIVQLPIQINGNGAPIPVKKTDAHYNDLFKQLLGQAMTGNNEEEFADSLAKLVKGIMYFATDLDRRKVGKALSFSKPGKGVDVLLGAS
jgi:hypothetical protein